MRESKDLFLRKLSLVFVSVSFVLFLSSLSVAGNINGLTFDGYENVADRTARPSSERLWQTGGVSSTGSQPAITRLSDTRFGGQKTAQFTINPGQMMRIAESMSSSMGREAKIPAGTPITFSSSFTQTSGNVLITWKLYVASDNGKRLICQVGDDASGGTAVSSGTVSSTNTTCINQDITLSPSDRILLVINGYNSHGTQARSIVYAWDGMTSSFVDVKIE